MESHYNLTDAEFESQFANASLNAEYFTHEAHLRLAWIHLNNYGLEKAIANIRSQLQQYTLAQGAAAKYNDTVTVAAIRIVHHFIKRSTTNNFQSFIHENARLKHNFKELIKSHYRTNIFTSEQAKRGYVKPELLPFD